MTYLDHLRATKGSLIKTRRNILRERRWSAEDWYRNWDTVGPELEKAMREYLDERRTH